MGQLDRADRPLADATPRPRSGKDRLPPVGNAARPVVERG